MWMNACNDGEEEDEEMLKKMKNQRDWSKLIKKKKLRFSSSERIVVSTFLNFMFYLRNGEMEIWSLILKLYRAIEATPLHI